MGAEGTPYLSRRHTTSEVLLLLGLALALALVVFASVWAYFDTVDDDDILLISWSNGTNSLVESGWWQPRAGGLEADTEVYGTTGYARIWAPEEPSEDYEHCTQPMYTAQLGEFLDAVGEGRLASFAGVRLVATGSVGAARFAWSPRTLEIDGGLGGPPVVVDFAPTTALEGGGGLAVRRALGWDLEAALAAERSFFALSTSHRRGDAIVTERETFGTWTGRVEITRRLAGL